MDKERLLNRTTGFYALVYDTFIKNFNSGNDFLDICEKCKDFQFRKAIDCAVNTLPADLESCFKLRYGYKFSTPLTRLEDITNLKQGVVKYSELGLMLNLDEKIVKGKVAEAKQKLRNADVVSAIFKNLGVIPTKKSKYPPISLMINKDLAYILNGFGIFTLEELTDLTLDDLIKIIDIQTSKVKRSELDKQFTCDKLLESLKTVITKYNLTLKSDDEDNVKL